MPNDAHAFDDLLSYILCGHVYRYLGVAVSESNRRHRSNHYTLLSQTQQGLLGHARPPHRYPSTKVIVLESSQVSWR